MDYYQSSLFKSLRARWFSAVRPWFFVSFVLGAVETNAWAITQVEWAPEAGISFPQVLSIGVEARCQGSESFCRTDLKFYLSGGYFRYPLVNADRSGQLWSAEAGARYFPFSFPLRFALGFGYRSVGITADTSAFTVNGEVLATSSSLNFYTFYFSPSVGYSVKLSKKLLLGFELGLQVSLMASGRLFLSNSNNGQDSNNSSLLDTESGMALGRVASLLLPTVTLARLTWYFDGIPEVVTSSQN